MTYFIHVRLLFSVFRPRFSFYIFNSKFVSKLLNIANINCKIQVKCEFLHIKLYFVSIPFRSTFENVVAIVGPIFCFLISVSSSLQRFALSLICCDSALFDFLWWIYQVQSTIKNSTFHMFLWTGKYRTFVSRYRYPVVGLDTNISKDVLNFFLEILIKFLNLFDNMKFAMTYWPFRNSAGNWGEFQILTNR